MSCFQHTCRAGLWSYVLLCLYAPLAFLQYMFTISWPASWAAKGYTSFTFGFESLEDAKTWHSQLQVPSTSYIFSLVCTDFAGECYLGPQCNAYHGGCLHMLPHPATP